MPSLPTEILERIFSLVLPEQIEIVAGLEPRHHVVEGSYYRGPPRLDTTPSKWLWTPGTIQQYLLISRPFSAIIGRLLSTRIHLIFIELDFHDDQIWWPFRPQEPLLPWELSDYVRQLRYFSVRGILAENIPTRYDSYRPYVSKPYPHLLRQCLGCNDECAWKWSDMAGRR